MLKIDKIHEEIKELEECDCTSWDVCKKLAILYIIRDHYKGGGTDTRAMDSMPTPSTMMSTPSMSSMK